MDDSDDSTAFLAPSYRPLPLPPSTTKAIVLTTPATVRRLVQLLLERAGMSQTEVAKRLGITQQALQQYVAGRRQRTSLEWLARLAEVCGARVVVEWPTYDEGNKLG